MQKAPSLLKKTLKQAGTTLNSSKPAQHTAFDVFELLITLPMGPVTSLFAGFVGLAYICDHHSAERHVDGALAVL